MTSDHLKNAALPRALSDALADVADLIQKELRLARAELSKQFVTKLQGGAWMAVAGVLGLVALLLLVLALVHGIASFGIALHWSYLIVAAVVALGAGLAFFRGRSDMRESLTPERSIRSLKNDISAAKEHLA
ncbi:phage holin family protein [Xanthobacteraceae bacterium Astr-EGSB]|uniref:phage holin family protein n=1 Tax=Astrobacterium formosum TaxID=3069710 RepID=UPI0027AF21F7|nr:phage holin family protein [Xanthobacteraceae bacterium Astr-EGSB]